MKTFLRKLYSSKLFDPGTRQSGPAITKLNGATFKTRSRCAYRYPSLVSSLPCNGEHFKSLKSSSGISFCGSDVGGFFGDPEDELFVRWYQAAVYQPFFRSHSHEETPRREPYLLTEPSKTIVREALRSRYALLPFWYTMFYEHERFGSPIMRPMLAEYPLDINVFNMDEQYMLSDKLLVRPVLEEAASSVNVYLPSDLWYDFDDYSKLDAARNVRVTVDIRKVPVYQKGGTIIPKKETVRTSSVHMIDDPVSLFIALDDKGEAEGTLFIDDEQSYQYRHGSYLYLKFEFRNNTLASRLIDNDVSYSTKVQVGRILIAGIDKVPEYAVIDGRSERFDVITTSEKYFAIEMANLSMKEQWTITLLNGSGKNVLQVALLVSALLMNLWRSL